MQNKPKSSKYAPPKAGLYAGRTVTGIVGALRALHDIVKHRKGHTTPALSLPWLWQFPPKGKFLIQRGDLIPKMKKRLRRCHKSTINKHGGRGARLHKNV